MTNMIRNNIDTNALLVEFSASVWTARKLDKSVTEEVVHDKGAAAKDAARVNKHLLAGRTELEVIQNCVNRIRDFVNTNTMPWSDNGIRLLPTKHFLAFNDRMAQYEQEFADLVKKFVDVYPTLITAQAMALGDMFKRDDYPSADAMATRFGFRLNYMPVPTSGDFRVDVGNEAQEELKRQLEKIATQRIDNALNDVRRRVKEHLVRMMNQLNVEEVNGEVKKGKLYDSLITNGIELCDLLEGFNLTNDPAIDGIRVELRRILDGMDMKELKKYPDARLEVRDKVAEIMDKFAF